MEKYVVLEKRVGETPLDCAEKWRGEHPEYQGVSLAYAGRLDPMASGKLLILVGDECKRQTDYHGLDKAYEFSVLFGIASDTQDVLGRLTTCHPPSALDSLDEIAESFVGPIEFPYPIFSSKTVKGKPLHTWTLEGRLDEIEIPTRTSTVYSLSHRHSETIKRADVVEQALAKINSIPPVTDLRKAIGNDFRRVDVRHDWDRILNTDSLPESYHIAHFSCIASSGTYMRTLASEIAKALNTCGLAWLIHREDLGRYNPDRHDWDLRY
jgi:tRNA pseudouridine55 synthase